MTTALYRRYRPDTFQDVIGQEHVTAPLMAALRADRVTHAYLFSGPRGCGKTTSARILARCLNCERYPTDTPCGECPSCRDLATGGPGSLDVVEIDAASHNGVDDARDLRERAAFAPARDRFKIFILDEAHMVTPQGFNALLKLVEEPPAHVKFIFATTEPEKVIGTIRSRTHHYPFRLVPPDVLEAYLAQLCQAEGVEVGAGVFPLVTRAGGGSVRDTLSVMDQLIGGAVDGGIDYQRAVALLGYTDVTLLDECVDAIAAADGAGVFRVVDHVISSGHDPRRFVEDLLQRLRDLLVIALAGAQAGPALGSVPADQMARMEVQARTLGSGALSRFADLTAQALTGMVGATSPRLQLELLMARLLVPSGGSQGAVRPASPAGTTSQLVSAPAAGVPGGAGRRGLGGEDLVGAGVRSGDPRTLAAQIAQQASGSREGRAEGQPGVGVGRVDGVGSPAGVVPERNGQSQPDAVGPSGARPPVEAEALATGREPQVDSGADTRPEVGPGAGAQVSQPAEAQAPGQNVQGAAEAQMIRSRWGEVLDAAKRSRRATWALVEQHAQPGALRDGAFQILFTAPGLVGAFENGGHGPVLAEAIHQALGVQVECRGVLVGGPDAGGPGAANTGGPGGLGGPGGSGGPGAGGPGPVGSGGAGAAAVAHGAGGRAGVEVSGRVRSPELPTTSAGGQPSPRGRAQRPQARDGQPGSETVGGESDEDPHRAGTGQPAAPAELVEPQSVTPEPSNQPEPAVVGWGEVAPIGRARQVADTETRETGASGVTDAQAAAPVAVAASSPTPAPDAAAVQERVQPTPSQPPAHREDTGLAQVTRLHPLPAVPAAPAHHLDGPATSAPTAPVSQPTSPHDTAGTVSSAAADLTDPAGPDAHDASQAPPEVARSDAGGLGAAAVSAPVVALHGQAVAGPSASTTAQSAPTTGAPRPRLGQAAGQAAGQASSSESHQTEEETTFSDGVPVPPEPGDLDGPGGPETNWTPPSESIARAMAVARAAAQGHAPAQEADHAGPGARAVRLEDDVPSEDDEDAEEAGVVGLEVVKRILGATVLEDVIINPEDH